MIRSIRPRSYKKYLALPIFGPIIDDFAEWSRQRGYTRGSIRNQLAETRQLVDFLLKKDLQTVDQLTHGDFDAAWHHFHHNRPAIAGTGRNIQRFLDQTHGLPAVPPTPKTRTQNVLELFFCYLKEIRGLVDTTIHSHLSYLERFLDVIDFEKNKQALPGLNLKQVADFIYSCSRNLNRHRYIGNLSQTKQSKNHNLPCFYVRDVVRLIQEVTYYDNNDYFRSKGKIIWVGG